MLRRTQRYLSILAAIGTISLSACTKTLDVSQIETAIQADLSKRGRLSIQSITCPTDIKSEPGKSFECAGLLEPDGGFFVVVTQENDQGKVNWQVPNSWRLLNLSQLEAEIAQKLKPDAKSTLKIDCGGIYRPTQPGDSFECKLLRSSLTPPIQKFRKAQPNPTPSPSATIVVRVEPEGKITWQEVRMVAAAPSKVIASPAAANNAQSTTELSPDVGVKDDTGWTRLAD
ncbi:MAG: DUF4333 domain-containing protein [Scytolyngbya sp. HA4215-MV1]|nr:DUF4333 domain-containing protein [Scytolyngbya sp. HA4215-MV1]